MTSHNPMELAKQGDPQAIATLFDNAFKKNGIATTVEEPEAGYLYISVKAAQAPPQQKIVEFVRNGMTKIDSPSIYKVTVEGFQQDTAVPAWSEDLPLRDPPEPELEAAGPARLGGSRRSSPPRRAPKLRYRRSRLRYRRYGC